MRPEELDTLPFHQVVWMTYRLREYLANREAFLEEHFAFFDDPEDAPSDWDGSLDTYPGPRLKGNSGAFSDLGEEYRGEQG